MHYSDDAAIRPTNPVELGNVPGTGIGDVNTVHSLTRRDIIWILVLFLDSVRFTKDLLSAMN